MHRSAHHNNVLLLVTVFDDVLVNNIAGIAAGMHAYSSHAFFTGHLRNLA